MPLTRLIIKNFKSIKNCDISLSELNVLIGENGTGKTNLLDAISYFYRNLTDSDISVDFLRKEKKTCNFNDFKKYWDSLQKTDQINVLRIVFNGKSDLLKTWKELSKGIAADKKLILEKAMIGGKTSGWVSDYLDTFFQSVFQIEGAFSEKAFRKYLENEDHLKSTLREFENNFPELYSLIERLCDIICE